MSEWISVKDKLPEPYEKPNHDTSGYVWITDGELIEIGKYIYRPRSYGCAVDDDEQDATCGNNPHWHGDDQGSSFIRGDRCFGRVETFDVTHWMPLPKPPGEKDE